MMSCSLYHLLRIHWCLGCVEGSIYGVVLFHATRVCAETKCPHSHPRDNNVTNMKT